MVVKIKSLKSKKKSISSYKLVSKKKSKMVKGKKMNKKNSKSTKRVSKKRYTGRRKYFTNGKKIRKVRKILRGGDPCEYVNVEGIKLPQLDIPDQLAKLNNDCNTVTTPTGSPMGQHPNIGN